MNTRIKYLQYSLFTIFLLHAFFIVSCESPGTSDTETTNQDPLITFIIERPSSHGEWKDEVTVHSSGEIEFRRLEGEEKPSSSRMMDENEFLELEKQLDHLYALGDECPEYNEESVELYTITYNGPLGEKIVRCDGSAFGSNNSKLRSIVFLLREFRTSLIGEEKFADRLGFELTPEQTVVDLDEPIILRYRVTNITGNTVDIGFSSGCQLGFKIYQEGEIVFSSHAFGCTGALTSWEIPSFSTEIKKFEWDHSTFDGSIYHDRKVKSGTYTIIQYLRNGNSPYQSTEITITEKGDQALQPRVVYKRHDDPSAFIYELNNRIFDSFSFDFSTDRKVGFRIREYDVQSQTPGEIIFTDTTGIQDNTHLTIEPFEEYAWTETWDRRDHDGNLVPQGFYWTEMWLLEQEKDYRAGRRVFIDG